MRPTDTPADHDYGRFLARGGVLSRPDWDRARLALRGLHEALDYLAERDVAEPAGYADYDRLTALAADLTRELLL